MKLKRAGFLTKIVVLALLIYMATSLLDLRGQIQTAQVQRDTLARQVSDQRLENQELEAAIENSDDPEMLEQVAREKGHVKQDEIVIYRCGQLSDPVKRALQRRNLCVAARGNLQGGYISRLWSLVLGPLWMGRLRESQNSVPLWPCRKGDPAWSTSLRSLIPM